MSIHSDSMGAALSKGKPGKKPRNGPREPNGRISRSLIDRGTDEMRMQRVAAHGMDSVGTCHPLDALEARGELALIVDGETFDERSARNIAAAKAASQLYLLHRRVFGAHEPGAVDMNRIGGRDNRGVTAGDEDDAVNYRAMIIALRLAGSAAYHVTTNLVVYCRPLPPASVRPERRARELAALQLGLAAIANLRPERTKRRAA